jgi:hypothetical protein
MSGPFTQLTSAAFTLICPATQHRMSSKHQLTGPEKHCAGKAPSTPLLPALEQDLWYFLICPDPEKQVSEGLARIGLWEDLAWSPHFYFLSPKQDKAALCSVPARSALGRVPQQALVQTALT